MEKILVVLLFTITSIVCKSQVSPPIIWECSNPKVVITNGSNVITGDVTCNGRYVPPMALKLNNRDSETLVFLLDKSLEWYKINKTKELKFEKKIGGFSTISGQVSVIFLGWGEWLGSAVKITIAKREDYVGYIIKSFLLDDVGVKKLVTDLKSINSKKNIIDSTFR